MTTETTVKALSDLAVVGVATGLTLRIMDKSMNMEKRQTRSRKGNKNDLYRW